MKTLLSACLLLAVLSGPSRAATATPDPRPAAKPASAARAASGADEDVPVAVRQFLKRAELCEHFAGEFSGDRSKRDREVNEQLRKNRCDRVSEDLGALRTRYKDQPAVLKRLQAVE